MKKWFGGGGVTAEQNTKCEVPHRTGANRSHSHLASTVSEDVTLLDDLYTISSLEVDFVGMSGDEVEERVDIPAYPSYPGGFNWCSI